MSHMQPSSLAPALSHFGWLWTLCVEMIGWKDGKYSTWLNSFVEDSTWDWPGIIYRGHRDWPQSCLWHTEDSGLPWRAAVKKKTKCHDSTGGKSSNDIIYLEIFHWDLKYRTVWLLPSRKPMLMSCPRNCLIPKPVLPQCAILSKTSLCAETISMEIVIRDWATSAFVHCLCCCLPWPLEEKVHRNSAPYERTEQGSRLFGGPHFSLQPCCWASTEWSLDSLTPWEKTNRQLFLLFLPTYFLAIRE